MCLAVASAVLFLSLPRFAHSQQAYPDAPVQPSPDVPVHAHYSATEQGWTCDDGYKQAAGYCMEDRGDVPSQGPFEVFEGQWRCRPGYKRSGDFCTIPSAPDHATVEPGGRWECDWGYRKVASKCEEIDPPEHGYLDASGHEWVCYPGYERSSDQCTKSASEPSAQH